VFHSQFQANSMRFLNNGMPVREPTVSLKLTSS